MLAQLWYERLIQRSDAVVVKLRGDCAIDWHGVWHFAPCFAIALHLFTHVAQGIFAAFAIELVDRKNVGVVEHIDFFELARRAKLRCHDIQRGVDVGHDTRVALTDAWGLDNNEIETAEFKGGNEATQARRNFHRCIASRYRTHHNVGVINCIHADAVAEQRAAGLTPRRIYRQYCNFKRVARVLPETSNDFVGCRRLACPASAGDTEHGGGAGFCLGL